MQGDVLVEAKEAILAFRSLPFLFFWRPLYGTRILWLEDPFVSRVVLQSLVVRYFFSYSSVLSDCQEKLCFVSLTIE